MHMKLSQKFDTLRRNTSQDVYAEAKKLLDEGSTAKTYGGIFETSKLDARW